MKTALQTLAIASLAISLPAFAGGRDELSKFTAGLKGLDGSFQQTVYDANNRATEKSSGTVQLSAPRLFRWETLAPSKQLIVADGNHIWIFDPDLEQVTVRNQSFEEQGSPLTILIDPTELDRQFKASDGGKVGGLDWLVLTPKKTEDAAFQQAKLGFGPAGLAKMEFSDSFGQRTVVAFTSWKRNPSFAKTRFTFTPPKGADVIGDVGEGAQVTPLKD